MTRDIKKAKKELNDYIYDKKWIEGKWQDLEERRSLLSKITPTLSDMPKGTNDIQDRQAECLVDILDKTNELEDFIRKLKEKQIEIECKIDKLEQPYKNILYFRYIRGYNLTEVSGEIEEEYDYTRKLHGIALIKYAELEEK